MKSLVLALHDAKFNTIGMNDSRHSGISKSSLRDTARSHRMELAMSSLNSTPDYASVLRSLVIDDKKISWKELEETGLDGAFLETKMQLIKPQLQFLGMFQPLNSYFTQPHHKLTRAGLAVLENEGSKLQCIRLEVGLEILNDYLQRRGYVHLFLGKDGRIVVVNAIQGQKSTVGLLDTISEAVKWLRNWRGGYELKDWSGKVECHVHALSQGYNTASIAGRISEALDLLVSKRVDDRKRQLESMEALLAGMQTLDERIVKRD